MVSEKRARKEMKSVVEVRLPAPLNRVSRREVQALQVQLQLQLQLHASKCCSMDVVLPVRGVRCSAEGGSEQPFQVRSVLRTTTTTSQHSPLSARLRQNGQAE
jgi:hypothetical protein